MHASPRKSSDPSHPVGAPNGVVLIRGTLSLVLSCVKFISESRGSRGFHSQHALHREFMCNDWKDTCLGCDGCFRTRHVTVEM